MSTVSNKSGNLRIVEVDPNTEATDNSNPIITFVDSADKTIVKGSRLDVSAGVRTPKNKSGLEKIVASVVVSLGAGAAAAVKNNIEDLSRWAANQLYNKGKEVTVSAVESYLKSNDPMVKSKIKSYKSSSKTQNVGGVSNNSAISVSKVPVSRPSAVVRAPVAYGNVMSGKQTLSYAIKDGHVVRGREFLASAYGSGTIATWTMCTGTPLTPVSFVDSVLRMYGSMYSFCRWRKLTAHYVTASPTSTSGSVMFYYCKDRSSVFINQTSANLLPFVLSDPHTMISPQWQNFSVELEVPKNQLRTDYGMTDDLGHYAAGEIFLMSQTSTTDTQSPGHLLLDYEIEFTQKNLTPRLLLWPQPTINFVPYSFQLATVTAGNSIIWNLGGINPFNSANTNRLLTGGLYKVIFDVTNSTLGTSTPASTVSNILKTTSGGTFNSLVIGDGTTLYGANSTTGLVLYPNASSAYSSVDYVSAATTFTAAGTDRFILWLSLIGFIGTSNVNPSM